MAALRVSLGRLIYCLYIEGKIDGQTDEQMDGLTDGPTERRERKDREIAFIHPSLSYRDGWMNKQTE